MGDTPSDKSPVPPLRTTRSRVSVLDQQSVRRESEDILISVSRRNLSFLFFAVMATVGVELFRSSDHPSPLPYIPADLRTDLDNACGGLKDAVEGKMDSKNAAMTLAKVIFKADALPGHPILPLQQIQQDCPHLKPFITSVIKNQRVDALSVLEAVAAHQCAKEKDPGICLDEAMSILKPH